MTKVLINEETKQLILDFKQQDAKNAYVFQNIADMLDNIKEGAEGIVICIALENYLKTEQCYRLFTKSAVEEIPF